MKHGNHSNEIVNARDTEKSSGEYDEQHWKINVFNPWTEKSFIPIQCILNLMRCSFPGLDHVALTAALDKIIIQYTL